MLQMDESEAVAACPRVVRYIHMHLCSLVWRFNAALWALGCSGNALFSPSGPA